MKDIKPTKKLNQIRALLGLEISLEQIALDNGVVFEAESFEPGQPVFVLAEGERMPVPVGEFELPDGRVLVVMEEGVISEMRSMEEEPAPEEQEMEADPEATAKKVVEEVRKETHFSEEDSTPVITAYPTERIEELETRMAALEALLSKSEPEAEEKVEVEASEEVKEIEEEVVEVKAKKHSPELPNKKSYSQRIAKNQTMAMRVLNHLYNN